MKSENRPTTPEMSFTETESAILDALRARYQQDRGLFTVRELAKLQFLRWLRENRPVADDTTVWICSQNHAQTAAFVAEQNFGDSQWCAH